MWGVWTFAHSTPLEFAADLGLPLTGFIGLAWLVVLVVLIRGVRTRRNDRIVPAGALAVAILVLAHSVIDFSLAKPWLLNCRIRSGWRGLGAVIRNASQSDAKS